jgi:hypothetical protein
MKLQLQPFSYLLALLLAITSCSKDPGVTSPPNPSIPPPIPVNREYFWDQRWNATSRGYEIHLDTWNLTQQEINRGIDVYVALSTEMSLFNKIPNSVLEPFFPDTVHLSYTAIPGHLQVIATASFDMTGDESDLFIEYK